jgi:lipoprotein-anchoring transpeptidase ErfK/SrfK
VRGSTLLSFAGAALACAFALVTTPARAQVLIEISRARQTLSVFVDNVAYATWPVSTARRGYRTPVGTFRPQRLERVWYSHIYNHAPMPNSIFFAGGYAIHGTIEIRNLGRPVSHGCIRLLPAHAKELFELVKSHGLGATRIVISRASTRGPQSNAFKEAEIGSAVCS